MKKIILLRHGESVWNREGRITGWTDIDLTEKGVAGAVAAGRVLRSAGVRVDMAFVSALRRAGVTLQNLLEALGQNPPVCRTWRLNERHFGMLQGLTSQEICSRYGDDAVARMVFGYDVPVPQVPVTDAVHTCHSPLYRDVPVGQLPSGESFRDLVDRVRGVWSEMIFPSLASADTVLVVAHGNVLGAVVKVVKDVPDELVPSLILPNAVPYVLEFDAHGSLAADYLLCDDGRGGAVKQEYKY